MAVAVFGLSNEKEVIERTRDETLQQFIATILRYIHTYIHTCIQTYLHTYTYMHRNTCIHSCIFFHRKISSSRIITVQEKLQNVLHDIHEAIVGYVLKKDSIGEG